jgi:FMN-dependent NADH-azoreductase
MDTRDSFLQHRLSKRLDMGIEVNTRVQQFLTSISTLQGEWRYVVKNAPALLDELQKAVIISSTGASTRIEGATMSDEEVERFLKQSHMRKLSTRDQQEVAGYLDAMQTVFDNFDSIEREGS